jgi:8-amino-7-oxononanoate synthase
VPDPDRVKSRLPERVEAELRSLREHAQFRALENLPGINLCSNDYLGLARDPRLKQAVLRAVAEAESMGGTGSRLLSGNGEGWEELEAEFARFAGTKAAVYFGSGYAANLGIISTVVGRGDFIFSDELNHASLIDGIRLSGAAKVIYPHGDMAFLERALREHSARRGAKLIVTESVFSMEGDVAPIERIIALAEAYGASLVVDEAHATGVYGPEGRGLTVAAAAERRVLATVHTCGKTLASAGAFVCCSPAMRDYLINRARTFVFTTAMPPYLAGQIRAALKLVHGADQQREHLAMISRSLRESLTDSGVDCGTSSTHIVPVRVGSNEGALRVAAELQRAGFAVRAIRPPTVPPGSSRVRLSLTASLSLEDVRRLAAATSAACKDLPRLLQLSQRSAISVHA